MYQSPIDVLIKDVKMQFEKGVDEQVHQAVVHVGINVDKAELIRALAYDREQYVKGYAEGLEDAVKHGRWIPLEYDGYADGNPVWDLWECSECQEEHSGDEDTLTPYCPNCGAKMDGDGNGN